MYVYVGTYDDCLKLVDWTIGLEQLTEIVERPL